jgi:hypothetical protein
MQFEEDAREAVEMSTEYPYDGDDRGNTAIGSDWTLVAARAAIDELGHCCKGIQDIFDSVEDPVNRMLIVETVAAVIRQAEQQRKGESDG